MELSWVILIVASLGGAWYLGYRMRFNLTQSQKVHFPRD